MKTKQPHSNKSDKLSNFSRKMRCRLFTGIIPFTGIIGICILVVTIFALPAEAQSSSVKSMKTLRDKGVVKQQLDYSCGAAALATILKYGFGDDVTERDILEQLFDVQSVEELDVIRREGFSLLDLQRVAQARGYKAQGFQLEPKYLDKFKGPVIVFIKPYGYEHFAVLRGVRDDRVFLADPSRGNIRMPGYAFLQEWLGDGNKGVIFVVEPKTGLPEGETALSLTAGTLPQPEMMTARELLAVGNPFVTLP